MQIKRSPMTISHLNNNKQNTLMQPLIGISKASTPVRTRLIGGNSTPVNQNKIHNFHKSPNNKENHQSNHIKLEGCIKTYAQPQIQNRINLSPILALNRKMNEGVKPQQKKSLTPQSCKVNDQYENYGLINCGSNPTQKNYQTLNDSKAYPFNNTGNFSNLRNSNSFKNLIQGRCKTPNRFQTHGNLNDSKRQQIQPLKESMSSNQLFKQFSKENRPKLSESRSFDRFKPLSTLSSLQCQLKCMNNDGKRAKYRVINDDSEEANQMQLYYCSKCTIPLVQQGFIVEELDKQTVKQQYYDENARRMGQYKFRLENKKNSLQFLLKDINKRECESLNQINRYYSFVFQFLQTEKANDANYIMQYYQDKKNHLNKYLQDINSTLEYLTVNRVNKNRHQIDKIIAINDKQLIAELPFQLNSQILISNFQQNYDHILKIGIQSKAQSAKHQEPISSRNHAMRFSFQKLLTDINHKKSSIRSIMNPLQQEDEQAQNECETIKEEHTAFRDLFPQEPEHTNNGIHSPTFKNF